MRKSRPGRKKVGCSSRASLARRDRRASEDLRWSFPAPRNTTPTPSGVTERRKGGPAKPRRSTSGPRTARDSARASSAGRRLPFAGSGRSTGSASMLRSSTSPSGRSRTTDIRLYQAHASAKYSGVTNYEQPMHIDRNHSWLPPGDESPWWNLEGFLYLSDVDRSRQPDPAGLGAATRPTSTPYAGWSCPTWDPDLYAAERPAPGSPRVISRLPVRRAITGARRSGSGRSARFVSRVAFKNGRGGLDRLRPRSSRESTGPEWTRFAEGSTPRELELFGFPPPGHPVWNEALLDQTALRYPALDLGPWRAELSP